MSRRCQGRGALSVGKAGAGEFAWCGGEGRPFPRMWPWSLELEPEEQQVAEPVWAKAV